MLPSNGTGAGEVEKQIARLWGGQASQLVREQGPPLHVAAVWRDGERGVVLKIEHETPRSANDLFALGLARARADAILATGAILRAESDLSHDLGATGPWGPALSRWRREVAGLVEPPRLAILTSGRGLDPEHAALHGEASPVLFVPESKVESVNRVMRASARSGSAIEVCSLPDEGSSTGAEVAIHQLRKRYGCERISVEAGPSTVAALYGDRPKIGLLLLSSYLEQSLSPSLQAGELPRRSDLSAAFEIVGGSISREESGQWSFELWVRRG